MSHPRNLPDLRDERAADRDEAAGRRDDVTRERDAAADQRDAAAAERDNDAREGSDDLTDHIRLIGRQILDHLARIENATVDPDDWPDLGPAALARLDAHTAEQRRLAALDREAVVSLLDQLHQGLGRLRQDRHAAARDRAASARDRHHSGGNRDAAGQDRDLSARDRNQAVIEREQSASRTPSSGPER